MVNISFSSSNPIARVILLVDLIMIAQFLVFSLWSVIDSNFFVYHPEFRIGSDLSAFLAFICLPFVANYLANTNNVKTSTGKISFSLVVSRQKGWKYLSIGFGLLFIDVALLVYTLASFILGNLHIYLLFYSTIICFVVGIFCVFTGIFYLTKKESMNELKS